MALDKLIVRNPGFKYILYNAIVTNNMYNIKIRNHKDISIAYIVEI